MSLWIALELFATVTVDVPVCWRFKVMPDKAVATVLVELVSARPLTVKLAFCAGTVWAIVPPVPGG